MDNYIKYIKYKNVYLIKNKHLILNQTGGSISVNHKLYNFIMNF